MLIGHVVVAIALAKLRVTRLGHIRRCMGQRRPQAHANDKGGIAVARHGAAHIPHRQLDAARDDGRGVKQGAVPVKGDQVELPGPGGRFRR